MRAAAAWAAALIAPVFGIQVIRVHVETLNSIDPRRRQLADARGRFEQPMPLNP